ncbi:MAG TPA: DUF2855 family protein [Burkholderiaceae bacterium]|nr:DUF2855 family protein [Burkholderiaceae bacterium]
MQENLSFVVSRSDLRQSRVIHAPLPALDAGEVLVRIDRFAFTANNVTYAEMGERMGYWQFYPAPDGWGNIPVWGFAEVADSRHEQVKRGERLYGFLPMATHVVLRPERVSEAGFVDGSAHRRQLPPAYNLLLRTAADAAYRPQDEDLLMLLRPVFITSFLIDDFLADEAFFGAQRVWLSSASSKTAFGLAHLLHRRGGIEVTGLTSAANRDFVSGLGCYDRVCTYDQIAGLSADRATVYVDFAGSAALRGAVQRHLGDLLVYSCSVGFSHRDHSRAPAQEDLPGARPVFFFAPDRLRKRAKDWDRDGIDTRFAQQWQQFVPAARQWLTVVRGEGPAVVQRVYAAALDGSVAPHEGHVLTLAQGDLNPRRYRAFHPSTCRCRFWM